MPHKRDRLTEKKSCWKPATAGRVGMRSCGLVKMGGGYATGRLDWRVKQLRQRTLGFGSRSSGCGDLAVNCQRRHWV